MSRHFPAKGFPLVAYRFVAMPFAPLIHPLRRLLQLLLLRPVIHHPIRLLQRISRWLYRHLFQRSRLLLARQISNYYLNFPSRSISVGCDFQYLLHSSCKKFLAHERLTENRQGHKDCCIQGRVFALAFSRNFKNFCIDGVLLSWIENFTCSRLL